MKFRTLAAFAAIWILPSAQAAAQTPAGQSSSAGQVGAPPSPAPDVDSSTPASIPTTPSTPSPTPTQPPPDVTATGSGTGTGPLEGPLAPPRPAESSELAKLQSELARMQTRLEATEQRLAEMSVDRV